ncbi:hypothetical protein [Luethyella okanaganae]|uniref:DUF559 domain-containing protein n=1 Tax=Luethyella okanaganae TaxID=69372 RepID=A0ABW1VJP0_9MICO
MRTPEPLPERLIRGGAFSTAAAAAAGVSAKRLRAHDLARPFRGSRLVRADETPTLWNLARAYRSRMPEAQFFSHATAAIMHRMPLPAHLPAPTGLHVSTLTPGARPRVRGVIGHESDPSITGVVERGGFRLSNAVDTWCQLAGILGVEDLVAVADFLITGDEPLSGRPPPTTLDELRAAVDVRKGRRGTRALRLALEQARYGPLSRMETLTRLLLVSAGLPEPEINVTVLTASGRFVAMVDLAYPAYRVGLEYEGDGHRERARFRKDITRRERIEDETWTIVRLSADDVTLRARETIGRVRSRLIGRGWVDPRA